MIDELPNLEDGLKSAYEKNKLVVFIGAGISRLMGCASWDTLANNLIDNCNSYGDAEQIKTAGLSSKEKITMAYEKVKGTRAEVRYWKTFADSIKSKPKRKKSADLNIYKTIASLNTLFVTTNCDGLMEEHLPANAWWFDFTREIPKHNSAPYLYYLHGRYVDWTKKEKDSLVFTVDTYLNAYRTDNPRISLLRNIFSNCTVLFLGYGLNEFELLDYLFTRTNNEKETRLEHYILEGFFEYQKPLLEAKRRYYKCLGIKLIPYSKENNGYEQQVSVISNWVDELKRTSTYSADIILALQSKIPEYNEQNKEYVCHYLKNDNLNKAYLSFALNKISAVESCNDWLNCIWDKGIVTPDDFPVIIRTEGGYRAQDWPFLSCIIECIDKNEDNVELQDFAVKIPDSIIKKVYQDDEHGKNWMSVGAVGEIILRLNAGHIEEKYVDYVKDWLEVDYSSVIIRYLQKIDSWLKWPEDLVNKLFSYVFSPPKNDRGVDFYSLNKLKDTLLEKASVSQLEFLYNICMQYLAGKIEDSYFYDDFETSFDTDYDNYPKILVQTITGVLKKISIASAKEKIKTIAIESKSVTDIQMSLYYATIFRIAPDFLKCFKENPLNFENTLADLYYYIEDEINGQAKFEQEIIELLLDWIDSASFGIVNDAGNNELAKISNTFRFQLFELTKDIDPRFNAEYLRLSKVERYERRHPKKEAASRIPKVQTVEAKTYFVDGELDIRNADALLALAREKMEEVKGGFNYHEYFDIYKELFEKIKDDKELIDDVFNKIPTIDLKYLKYITSVMWSDGISDACLHDSIITLLESLIHRLYDEKTGDDRNICVKNLVYILQTLHRNHWQPKKVLSFCLTIDVRKLWPVPEEIPDDCDIISKVINTPESEFYIVMIQCACDYKESSGVSEDILSFLDKKLETDSSVWLRLSLSYGIQNLYYLNGSWADEHIESIVTSNPAFVSHCIATICAKTNYIFSRFTEIIFSNAYLSDVLTKLNSSKKSQDHNISRIINYAVAAFYFGQICNTDYFLLLNFLIPKNFNDLFRSIVSDMTGERHQTPEEVFLTSYEHLSAHNSGEELSRAVIQNVSKMETASNITWKMVNDCINKSPMFSLPWFYIARIFENHSTVYYHEMLDVVKSAINRCSPPSLEIFNKIRNCFMTFGQNVALREIHNEMINSGYYQEEMSKYFDNEKRILDDTDTQDKLTASPHD